MKKILISLYIMIFLLVASINVISIKKFFNNKQRNQFDDIVAINYVPSLVSYNEVDVEVSIQEEIDNAENEKIVRENETKEKEIVEEKKIVVFQEEIIQDEVSIVEEKVSDNNSILYDGLTEVELVNKLERSLKNELSGTGINFVEYYKSTGLDPYLSVAIVLHETGCTWNCSNLVKECYNFGGMKGGENKYKDTGYTCYTSKEEGISAYLNMLYNNYYSKGLTTAELINPKYATSLEWSFKINNYIDKIKNS